MIRLLGAITMVLVAQVAFAQEVKLETATQKASYIIGQNIVSEVINPDVPFDVKALIAGFSDGLNKKPLDMSEEEINKAMKEFTAVVEQHMKKKAEAEVAKGKEFLAENAKKEGVKTTKSGLQYKVLKEGDGPSPKATDTVRVHYKGTFIDGKEFDSSYSRMEPATFPLNQVIAGWTEAVQLMKVGSKYQLFVPSDLAYGESGRGGIPPNTVLIFEVELLGIVEAAPAPLPGAP